MSEKMKNLWVRTVSGAVLAVVMLGAIAWSQWSFGLLLAALLVVGMTEFYSLAEEQGSNPQRIVGLAAGLVLFALNFAFVSDDIQILGSARQAFACGMALLLLLLPAMFICELYRRRENPAANIGITFMGVVYVGAAVLADVLHSDHRQRGVESVDDDFLRFHHLGQRRFRLSGGHVRRQTPPVRTPFAQEVVGRVLRRHRRSPLSWDSSPPA